MTKLARGQIKEHLALLAEIQKDVGRAQALGPGRVGRRVAAGGGSTGSPMRPDCA